MDDLISRQAAIDAVRRMQTYKLFEGDDMLLVDKAEVQTELMMLPSAEPQRWIPVTEKLPKDDGWQLVTILDESGDTPYRYYDFAVYSEVAGCWIVDANQMSDIIAWMPLPEPWKGGAEMKGEDDE